MSELQTDVSSQTIFERIWEQNEGHLFKSNKHGVMAIADIYPKLPFQVVVAPEHGSVGDVVRFSDLDRTAKRKMHEVADAFEEKIADLLDDTQRVITHIEGFGVKDHAHIVLFAAEQGDGKKLYGKESLGPTVVRNTIELVTFDFEEASLLEARLDHIL